MTPVEVAWAAGLFEGEGCFFINRVKKRGKTYLYPCACLKMTDEDVVRRFAAVLGFGTIWSKPSRKVNWKPSWDWRCHGARDVARLFALFRPYLGRRRLATGEEVLGAAGESRTRKISPV